MAKAHELGRLSGDGEFSMQCHQWLQTHLQCRKALLTHSCTGALEMAAILADIQPGDEIIMPSFTFVSTANAFVLRGAVPVFIDIREDTLNMDERLIEGAITDKTKAIVPVHYAGVGCDMPAIMKIADKYQLIVIEDAAQAILADINGKPLGSFGHMATLSFHDTKNIISGEGGALLVNDPKFAERAEIIREKGTNRSKFFRGEVDKYSWVDVGSSYLPSDLMAAFLWAQLEQAQHITDSRLTIWENYQQGFAALEAKGLLRRPIVPNGYQHNAHVYYLLLPSASERNALIDHLTECGIAAVSHYVPLHSAVAGVQYARAHGDMTHTNNMSERIVRLPLWVEFDDVTTVVDAVKRFY